MADLQRENDNLRRILEVTRYMSVTNDLDVLLGTIVESACEVLNCERATIFLYDPKTDELYSRVARGADEIRFPASKGIAGAAAQERCCVNVPDAYADPRFNPEIDRKTGYRTLNLLAFPLENLQGELIGVLQALNKHDGVFDQDDEELARILSAQAGVTLDRGRLIEEYAEKQRLERDLDIAREIQQGLLPKENPEIEGYEIAGWNRSADATGGDTYDFVPLPDGRLALLLADATGHGVGAALVIAQCRSLVRAMLTVTQNLPTISTRVNQLLAQDLGDERFVTAFLGILDPQKHTLEYIAAGQGPLIAIDDEHVENRTANALPFAVMPEMDYDSTESFRFRPGTTLALLTDGFYEAANAEGDQYGEGRVTQFIRERAHYPLPKLIDKLHESISHFVDDVVHKDDLTAVLIRRVH
ncbi:MAG: GAF domain-containing protein [Planctomycetota bacterium]|nr:MAG: GAF domain-containing protein [Planctomycetota bacterium]